MVKMLSMKQITDILYFEESTGFMYERKKFIDGFYFSPLNFCILECSTDKDNKNFKQNNHDRINASSKAKAVQEHRRHLQLRGQQEHPIGRGRLRSQDRVRVGTPGRIKVLYNKCSNGTCSVHKWNNRRNSVHNLLRTPPTPHLHGIRLEVRAKGGELGQR